MITKKNNQHQLSFFYIILGIFFGLLIIFFYLIKEIENKFENKIYPNVYVDNINFGNENKNKIIKYYQNKTNLLKNINLTINLNNQSIASFSGEILDLKYDGETAAERAYLIGRSKFLPSKYLQIISSIIGLKNYYFQSEIIYNNSLLNDWLITIKDSYNKPAKNALFEFKNNRVTSFRKEEYGQEIDEDKFYKDLNRFFDSLIKNKETKKNYFLYLYLKKIKPEITLSSLNNFGIEELIAIGQSDFSHSIPERIHNLTLAASKFHGLLIPPNKVFSFNENLGEVSSLTGYKPAYIIKDGKTILGDGGGVCQVSTTLFRASLNAGLEIIERHPHAYRVHYYENDMGPGFDASVFSPLVDLKIKNNTNSYILIQTEVDNNNYLLFFKLYGKKDDRQIEISQPIVWDVVPPPEPKYQEDQSLKKGVIKQIDFPAWGAKAYFTYKVYKNNKLMIDEKITSYYRPWQAVYLIGIND